MGIYFRDVTMPRNKTPSKMDVAPWNVHWIKMVLDGIEWY